MNCSPDQLRFFKPIGQLGFTLLYCFTTVACSTSLYQTVNSPKITRASLSAAVAAVDSKEKSPVSRDKLLLAESRPAMDTPYRFDRASEPRALGWTFARRSTLR